jgi:hypothetical protein
MSAAERLSDLLTTDSMRVDRTLSEMPPIEQSTGLEKIEPMVLTPISKPTENPEADYLYRIAFERDTHLTPIAQELFNNKGAYTPSEEERPSTDIRPYYETQEDGTLLSQPIVTIFEEQNASSVTLDPNHQ